MKVNYMKMIMAKGVFKMRAAEAWTCVCACVPCVCMRYMALFEGGACHPLHPTNQLPCPAQLMLPPYTSGNKHDETSSSLSSSFCVSSPCWPPSAHISAPSICLV